MILQGQELYFVLNKKRFYFQPIKVNKYEGHGISENNV